jgi:hypothetical protein
MALDTRSAPQKSFGRRPGPALQGVEPQPPAPPPVQDILRDAQPAANWLSEIAGQSAKPVPQPEPPPIAEPPVTVDQAADDAAPELGAGSVIGRSLQVVARNPVTFLAAFAAIALPEQTLAYLPLSLGLPAAVILPLFTTLGCMALYAATFAGALASLKGEEVNFDVCLRAVARTPAGAYGVIAMTVSSLSLMLILPAVGFAGRWALAAPVASVEGRDARIRSLALTVPYRSQIRLLVLVVAGLTLLRALLAVLFGGSSVVGALTGDWLFPMLLTVLVAVAGAVLYRDLVPGPAAGA